MVSEANLMSASLETLVFKFRERLRLTLKIKTMPPAFYKLPMQFTKD